MTCQECSEYITPLVDGELSADRLETVLVHVDACPACATRVRAEQAVKRLVRERAVHQTAPKALGLEIRKQLERISVGRGFWARRTVLFTYRPVAAYAVAAALVLALVGAYSLPYTMSPTTVPVAIISAPDQADGFTARLSVVEGQLVCVGCDISSSTPSTVDCGKFGHQNVLKTAEGTLWHLVTTDETVALIEGDEHHDEHVRITGNFYHKSRYVDVAKVEFV